MSEDLNVPPEEPIAVVETVQEAEDGDKRYFSGVFTDLENHIDWTLTGVRASIVKYTSKGTDTKTERPFISEIAVNVNAPLSKDYGDPGISISYGYEGRFTQGDYLGGEVGQFSNMYGVGPTRGQDLAYPFITSGQIVDDVHVVASLYGASAKYVYPLTERLQASFHALVGQGKSEENTIGYSATFQYDLSETTRFWAQAIHLKDMERNYEVFENFHDLTQFGESVIRDEFGLHAQHELFDGKTQLTYGVTNVVHANDMYSFILDHGQLPEMRVVEDYTTGRFSLRQKLVHNLEALFGATVKNINGEYHADYYAGLGYDFDGTVLGVASTNGDDGQELALVLTSEF